MSAAAARSSTAALLLALARTAGATEPCPAPLLECATEDEGGVAEVLRENPPMVLAELPEPTGFPRPLHRFVWENLIGGRLDPSGAVESFNALYRLQIWDDPEPIFAQTFLSAGVVTDLTPAFANLGVRVEAQPFAMLNLFAECDFVGAFGAFDFVAAYPNADADYRDSLLHEARDANASGTGYFVNFGALLQAQVWNIAIRNTLQAQRQRMGNLGSEPVLFYHPTYDLLEENGGFIVQNDADLVYVTNFGLKVAVRHTFSRTFYSEAVRGADGAASESTHRLGPAVVYTFQTAPPGEDVTESSVVFLAQWWIEHRYRTGEESGPVMPLLSIALIERGDFLP